MVASFFEQPILNSPYDAPTRHHQLDGHGQPLDLPPANGRRRSEIITPVPQPRRRTARATTETFDFGEGEDKQQYTENPIVNEIRGHLERWRAIPNPADWGVTPTTARLLTHWRSHGFQNARPFFCQIEAVETIIWLTEVAPKHKNAKGILENLKDANQSANPELFRLALKMATGAGKTTVMAMLIAWQTANAVRSPGSSKFSKGFLIVTPGITIKDRLQVLRPESEDSYYRTRELVPPDMLAEIVYERAPHVTLKSIANNAEIDIIYDKWQTILEPLRVQLNKTLSKNWMEWEIPREAGADWSTAAREFHTKWWEARITRQREIDASIARAADVETLYDRPYEDKTRVRVAGPFTVESLSPHRVVPSDEEELMDLIEADEGARRRLHAAMPRTDFAEVVLENLRTAGVHQSEKRDRINFNSLTPWQGEYIAAEGRFMEGETERRAAIFIGPEFGTLTRVDIAAAAREATDSRFDALIACAFAFDAHASEMTKLGPLPILKAKMNPDLHMAGDLKNTGKGNLFVVFGEPDIDIGQEKDGRLTVKVKGVDVFDPNTGEIRSNDTKGIAAWFIDTDYNEESFYVRHAYFLGANDPYKSLKTALQAEIEKEAWETLYSNVSRPFERPSTGKIAVKVINHFGDEVMKVFRV